MPRKIKTSEKKTGRRGNNEGSIYQRKDGRWCAQITVGYRENGKAIFKYAYGSTRQEVAKKLTEFTHEVFTNGYSAFAPTDSNVANPITEPTSRPFAYSGQRTVPPPSGRVAPSSTRTRAINAHNTPAPTHASSDAGPAI